MIFDFYRQLFAVCSDGQIYRFDYDSFGGLNNMTECYNTTLSFTERIGMISVSNSGDVAFASESHEMIKLFKWKEGGDGGKFDDPKLVTKCAGSTYSLAMNSIGSILCCSGT